LITAHIRHDPPRGGYLIWISPRIGAAKLLPSALSSWRREKVESTCAELDFGRVLYIHDISFRFVVRQMMKGSDYDQRLC
jgi:hypothetical protein